MHRHEPGIPATPTNTLLDNLVAWWEGDEAGGANDLVDDTGSHDLGQVSSPGA